MTEADLAELARVTRDLQLNPPKVPKPIPNMTVQNIRKRPIEVPTKVII